MKDITVINTLAFSVCQLAQSTDKIRRYLTGVFIEPSGRVTGTNGHYLVTCDNVVEPFKGKPIILAAKPLTSRQANRCDVIIHFDSQKEAMIICSDKPTTRKMLPRTILTASIMDGAFPDCQKVIPVFTGKEKGINEIAFNASYVARIAARLDSFTSTTKLKMKGPLDPIEITFSCYEAEGIKMVCMPQRV